MLRSRSRPQRPRRDRSEEGQSLGVSSSTERWLPILGYEGIYEVSSLGRVKALARPSRGCDGRRRLKERIFKCSICKSTGYVVATLRRADGTPDKQGVHRLVLAAFVGPAGGRWALHRDGSRSDPRLDNLYWGTPKDNAADSARHGTFVRGERHPVSLLTDELVSWVRETQQTPWHLSFVLDVRPVTIRRARDGKSWAHVA